MIHIKGSYGELSQTSLCCLLVLYRGPPFPKSVLMLVTPHIQLTWGEYRIQDDVMLDELSVFCILFTH
jgi:hypothetical protein